MGWSPAEADNPSPVTAHRLTLAVPNLGQAMARQAPGTTKATGASNFRFPSAFTILFGLIILALLTWIIPAGQYQRVASEVLGKDVPVAGTYAPTEANPQGMIDVILAPIAGFYDPSPMPPMPSTCRCSC
jgi:hypothetical protein